MQHHGTVVRTSDLRPAKFLDATFAEPQMLTALKRILASGGDVWNITAGSQGPKVLGVSPRSVVEKGTELV